MRGGIQGEFGIGLLSFWTVDDFKRAYHFDKHVITGHRDFVFALKTKALKIRYISRLFAKERECENFQGIAPDELLERMIELTLYMEENF